MSATAKIWSNGIAPTCEDDDLNGFKLENNNLIVGSGQGLSTADNQQTHKAVAHYAGVGDYYGDSGGANAYILSVTGTQVAPPTYASGMRIRFVAGNANTGASTVNVAGLGVKDLIRDVDGGALSAGIIKIASLTEAYYDGTDFRVVSSDVVVGTFTPDLFGSTSGTGTRPTYTARAGYYHVLDDVFFFNVYLVTSAITGITGNISIDGFPYDFWHTTDVALTNINTQDADNISLTSGYSRIGYSPLNSGTSLKLTQTPTIEGAGGSIFMTHANLSATTTLQVSGYVRIR